MANETLETQPISNKTEFKINLRGLMQSLRGQLDRKPKLPPNYPQIDWEADVKKLPTLYQEEVWQNKGFNLEYELSNPIGPMIEIAGPTSVGYETTQGIIQLPDLPNKVFVSNISPGCPIFNDKTGEFVNYIGKIDFKADARALPIAEGSLGALFASCLPDPIREKSLQEAHRVLKQNGLLVFQGLTSKDLNKAQELGFQIEEIKRFTDAIGILTWNAVMSKK